jgi:hypothetical protein
MLLSLINWCAQKHELMRQRTSLTIWHKKHGAKTQVDARKIGGKQANRDHIPTHELTTAR